MVENIFNIVSLVFKYIFIVIVYFFIFRILKLIYLDISSVDNSNNGKSYIKLLNKRETIPFKISEEYSIEKGLKFGRQVDNDVVLADNFVSKHHSEIIVDEGEYFIKDLDSSNGTYINEEKIEDVVKLKHGDRIGIGMIEFIFIKRDEKDE